MKAGLTTWACLALFLGLVSLTVAVSSEAPGLKLEAQLVWGTDDSKPPQGKNWHPVEPDLKKKIPLRWKNYYEVDRRNFAVKTGEIRREPMSDKCQIEVKNLDNASVEVTLFGKGKEVMHRKQVLPKGEILVLGGNAPNDTAWLVVLRQPE